jgi:hypothetical protein
MADSEQQKNNTATSPDLKKKIVDKIKSGEVTMRPKAYFVLKIFGLLALSILILITSALLFSFVLFTLRVSGRLFLLGLGWKGLSVFFGLFPWKTLIIEFGLLFILERLLRKFTFGYRHTTVYLVSVTMLLIIAAGFLLDATPIHPILFKAAREHRLPPPVNRFYEEARELPPHRDLFRATVILVSTSTVTIVPESPNEDLPNVTSTVALPPPRYGASPVSFKPGDQVLVAGTVDDDVLRIYGIRPLLPNERE